MENEILIHGARPDYKVVWDDIGKLSFSESDSKYPAIFLGVHAEDSVESKEISVWLLRLERNELDIFLHNNANLVLMPVRQVTRALPTEDIIFRLYRGLQVNKWLDRFQFCPTCKHPLFLSVDELALECSKCATSHYPTISPAMIVAITRNKGAEILLVRPKNRTGDWWGLVAGYAEAGESIEQTVIREVREETSISVQNIQYAESQSWPFGQSMMIGFTAEYAAGELKPDPSELEAAGWFSWDNLPPIPQPPSIGNRLITLVHSRYQAKLA